MTNISSSLKRGGQLLVVQLWLLFSHNLLAAVGFTVSPATVNNTYNGMLTLQVTGLSSGETVVVQKFLDANTNGIIDGADLLWQQFRLTDGQASVIGGVTNINVPGDTDATPGQITARLIFRNTDPVLNLVGKYAYKLSSPTGLFAPITNSFTITNAAYAQSLTGNVVNHGTNVPNAIVLLFSHEPGDNGPGSTVGGTVANNSGSYTIKVPAGTYAAVAFKSNYLGYFLPLPVTVGSGQTVVTNLALTNATRTLSGRLVDAANQSVGLPGLFTHATSAGLAAVVTSDPNGNFTFPVGPGNWEVGAIGAETLGYINMDSESFSFDTTTGNVSGVTISHPKANALFYGIVKDDQNQPLAGIGVDAENNDYSRWHYSFTDDQGNYVAGALAGETWEVEAQDEDLLPPYYLFPGNFTTNIGVGQAILLNFTGLRATNRITGQLQDNEGSPIPAVEIYAYAGIGGNFFYVESFTDTSGNYSMNVANGNWSVGVSFDCDAGSGRYCRPNNQNVAISNADAVVNFTSPGQIVITNASPLPDGQVDEAYGIQFAVVTCGAAASWSATNLPLGLALSPAGILSGSPQTCGSNYFFVRVSGGTGSCTSKGFSLMVHPPTNGGVWGYYVNKLISYRQTNTTGVILDSNQGPYNAYLGIGQYPLCSVSEATCTLPDSVVKTFPPSNTDLELQVHEVFASESAFDTAYPVGQYVFEIDAIGSGVQSAMLNLPTTAYPNAPRISNLAAAQAINPNSGFLLEWDAFSAGTEDDIIRLFVVDNSEVPAFKLWWYPEPVFEDWPASDATSVNIPPDVLESDRTYLGVLQFIRVVDVNEVDYTNAIGQTLVSAQTVFNLTTASATPTLSQPARLSATQFRFLLTGLAEQAYAIEKTTNLNAANWSLLLITNAPTVVLDPSATNGSAFYRARALFGPE